MELLLLELYLIIIQNLFAVQKVPLILFYFFYNVSLTLGHICV